MAGSAAAQLQDLQQKMSRFHGLTGSNPERKEIARQVETECTSVLWQVQGSCSLLCTSCMPLASACIACAECLVQLSELSSAVDVAAENPARFNLTAEELSSRRRWIEATQRQVGPVGVGACSSICHVAFDACRWGDSRRR